MADDVKLNVSQQDVDAALREFESASETMLIRVHIRPNGNLHVMTIPDNFPVDMYSAGGR